MHHKSKDATASENAKLAAKYALARNADGSSEDGSSVVSTIVDKGKESVEEQAVVKETIKEVEFHRVQPVVHRTREQTEIRHIIQPIIQQEVAPVQAREVIRETGVVREQVVHDHHAHGHSHSHGNYNGMMMMQQMGVMSGGEALPMQMTGCCTKSMSSGYRGHQHQVEHDEGCRGLMTGAGVLPSDAGGRPIQIHIHPVFYLSPGMHGIDWQNTLCSDCNAKVQPLMHGGGMVHHSGSHKTSSRDGDYSGSTSVSHDKESHHSHRISRFLSSKLRKRKSDSNDEDDSDSDETDNVDDDHSHSHAHAQNNHGTNAFSYTDSHSETRKDDKEKGVGWTDESHTVGSKIGGQATHSRDGGDAVHYQHGDEEETEVVRIVHTPVVI